MVPTIGFFATGPTMSSPTVLGSSFASEAVAGALFVLSADSAGPADSARIKDAARIPRRRLGDGEIVEVCIERIRPKNVGDFFILMACVITGWTANPETRLRSGRSNPANRRGGEAQPQRVRTFGASGKFYAVIKFNTRTI